MVVQNLAVGEAWAPIPALARFFTFTHVRNTGVSFGTLPGMGWIFMLVNVGVLIGILIFYPRIPAGQWPLQVACALVLAGDLGNMIDRLRSAIYYSSVTGSFWSALPNAYVTDFFDIKIWPVWNVSDMAVVSGTIIIGWMLWRMESENVLEEPAADEA
jgi:signal peptidase II